MRIAGVVASTQHAPHEIRDACELLSHLVTQHGYTAEALSGATTAYLQTMHRRVHQHMVEDQTGTIPELVGSSERLFANALETLEALLALDRELTRRLAARWAEALNALVR